MATIATYSVADGKHGTVEFDTANLGDRLLYRTMKDAIVQYQANRRQGDAHTKTRAEIRGSLNKPWKQKKTGRARHGDRRSPIWRGGGTTFGPRNKRNWGYQLPQKMLLAALRSALKGKLIDEEVRVVEGLAFEAPSSKSARQILADLSLDGSILLLLKEHQADTYKSFRNFPRLSVRAAADVTAYDLLAHKWVLSEEGALDVVAARCSAQGGDK